MPIHDAVIPVAGLGTRLLPLTRSQPKEMLPVLDRPVVQYVVEELVAAGVARVLFVTGRRKRAIEDHFDADPELHSEPLIDPRTGLQILYTRQAQPRGLGDAVAHAERFAGGEAPVVVALGDSVIHTPPGEPSIVSRLVAAYEHEPAAAAVVAVDAVPPELVSRYGVATPAGGGDVSPGESFAVAELVEKPAAQGTGALAIMARYVLAPGVFAALRETPPDDAGEVQLTHALQRLLDAGERVIGVRLGPGERRHDIGTIESYGRAFLDVALSHPRYGAALRAHAAGLLDAHD